MVELGGGVRAVAEYGLVRFVREPEAAAAGPRRAAGPGRGAVSATWEVRRRAGAAPAAGDLGSPDEPLLDAGRLARPSPCGRGATGDRMQPLGLDGTKSLQDLFGDRKVPRSLRRSLPVVESGDEIAWVAGVAVSERFKLDERHLRDGAAAARPCREGQY